MSAVLELSTCLLIAASVLGQEAAAAPDPAASPTAAVGRDGRRTIGRLPANLRRGTFGMFSRDGRNPALIGVAATGLGSFFDGRVEDRIADPSNKFARSVENAAGGIPSALTVAGVFAVGRFVDNPRFRAMSYDLLDASVVNGFWTTALKQTIGRKRPDGSDHLSFPSGHASNAFAIATVIERHYGGKAGWPAYVLASTVAVSRLQRDRHYLSDVLAGATLGYAVGRSVVRMNGLPLDASRRPQLSAVPIYGPRTRALEVRLTF
jgi:membrane-associated phospholipid phosphatase